MLMIDKFTRIFHFSILLEWNFSCIVKQSSKKWTKHAIKFRHCDIFSCFKRSSLLFWTNLLIFGWTNENIQYFVAKMLRWIWKMTKMIAIWAPFILRIFVKWWKLSYWKVIWNRYILRSFWQNLQQKCKNGSDFGLCIVVLAHLDNENAWIHVIVNKECARLTIAVLCTIYRPGAASRLLLLTFHASIYRFRWFFLDILLCEPQSRIGSFKNTLW